MRARHAKRILWILAGVIIVAFSLSGVNFYLAGRKNIIGIIDGKKITTSDLIYYTKMAQLHLVLTSQDQRKISRLDIENLGRDFLLLLWKAKQEKITADDKEVIEYIMKNLFSQRKFDKTAYDNFLKTISRRYNLSLSPRSFEEYIRQFIIIDKLFQKYITVEVKNEEVEDLYKKDTQKAKIAYLFIPYEKFKVDIGITPREIEEFYQKNQSLFKREPKVNIAYAIIDENTVTDKMLKQITQMKTMEELKERNILSLEIKETGFIGLNDPIEEIGWKPEINKIAFSLEKNTLSPFIQTEKGLLIMEKKEELPTFIPPLADIETEVKERLILERAKKEAEQFSQDLLKELNQQKIKDLAKIAEQKKLNFKETDYFRFYDYIEGLGLDREISEVIFSLEKDQIYIHPILREKGIYIIQLKEITPLDKDNLQKNWQVYFNLIKQNKEITKRMEFLTRLKEKTHFNLY